MKIKLYKKYPCGYEFELDIKTGFLGSPGLDFNIIEEDKDCPIHGKKCKK